MASNEQIVEEEKQLYREKTDTTLIKVHVISNKSFWGYMSSNKMQQVGFTISRVNFPQICNLKLLWENRRQTLKHFIENTQSLFYKV